MSETFLRLDKWLWCARFFKTRGLATRMCNSGRLRIGGEIVSKAHHRVRPGEILTFPQGRQIRVVKVLALAARRGPAAEARELFADLNPPSPGGLLPPAAVRAQGGGRPTKADRRALNSLRRIP